MEFLAQPLTEAPDRAGLLAELGDDALRRVSAPPIDSATSRASYRRANIPSASGKASSPQGKGER